MPKKYQYLEKHGNQWRVVVKVSSNARATLGKAHLREPLHTDSLPRAEALKWPIVAKLKAEIAEAERRTEMVANGGIDAVTAEALAWRTEAAQAEPIAFQSARGDEEFVENPVLEALPDRAEEIEKEHGFPAAITFAQIARGEATPLQSLLPAYFAESTLKPRTKIDYERAVERFATWTADKGLPGTIEAVSRRVAGRFISEGLIAKGVHAKTINKTVSALSAYWRWLLKRGHVEAANPWREQALPKRKSLTVDGERYKRPFTDEEIKALLTGDPKSGLKGQRRTSPAWNHLSDVMLIAALSGMRVEEIARLKVKDCQGDAFDIREAKTGAGVRRVPIHPDILPIITKLRTNVEPEAFLFPELNTPPPSSPLERSMPWVKAFGRYRQSLGVHEQEDGKRQARTDFHSFRRWFVTKAEQAGIPKDTVASVVGHVREGMTFGVYSGGPSWEQRKACVEAVCLPRQKAELLLLRSDQSDSAVLTRKHLIAPAERKAE